MTDIEEVKLRLLLVDLTRRQNIETAKLERENASMRDDLGYRKAA